MSSVLPPGRRCFRRCCCCASPFLPRRQKLPAVVRSNPLSVCNPPSSSFARLACSLLAGYPASTVAPAIASSSSPFVSDLGNSGGLLSWAYSCQRMERFRAGGSVNKNKRLVEQLQRLGVIRSTEVSEVMETVDRGLFLHDAASAYVDSPMLIGYNATISAPHMHAMCLELLKDHLKPGARVLDVGSGTGYLTACFSLMVGPGGRAVGVDHIPELVASSIDNIKQSVAAELLRGGSLSVHVADGRLGYPELAPFDAIHVGAAAAELPQALVQQLKPGGRMVIPVGRMFQELQVVDKGMDGSVSISTETSVRYVPLTSREAQLQG